MIKQLKKAIIPEKNILDEKNKDRRRFEFSEGFFFGLMYSFLMVAFLMKIGIFDFWSNCK